MAGVFAYVVHSARVCAVGTIRCAFALRGAYDDMTRGRRSCIIRILL